MQQFLFQAVYICHSCNHFLLFLVFLYCFFCFWPLVYCFLSPFGFRLHFWSLWPFPIINTTYTKPEFTEIIPPCLQRLYLSYGCICDFSTLFCISDCAYSVYYVGPLSHHTHHSHSFIIYPLTILSYHCLSSFCAVLFR